MYSKAKRDRVLDSIPTDYPVRPLGSDVPAEDPVQCNTCGLSWDDALVTGLTPAPSARCPFEPFHEADYIAVAFLDNAGCQVAVLHLDEAGTPVGLDYPRVTWVPVTDGIVHAGQRLLGYVRNVADARRVGSVWTLS